MHLTCLYGNDGFRSGRCTGSPRRARGLVRAAIRERAPAEAAAEVAQEDQHDTAAGALAIARGGLGRGHPERAQ